MVTIGTEMISRRIVLDRLAEDLVLKNEAVVGNRRRAVGAVRAGMEADVEQTPERVEEDHPDQEQSGSDE